VLVTEALQWANEALYVAIFAAVLVRAVRRPRRATVDAALLFGATALIVADSWATRAGLAMPPFLTVVVAALLMSLAYLFLRLVDGVADVPRWAMPTAAGGLALAVVGLVVAQPFGLALTLLYVAYFVAVVGVGVVAVMRSAARANGVTRRRLYAVAAGAGLLGLVLMMAGVQAAEPGLGQAATVVSGLAGLGSGLAFFVGFATPAWLRRAWQEPELRRFLADAAALPRLPDTAAMVEALERSAAAACGVARASVGLWDADARALRFGLGDVRGDVPTEQTLSGRVYAEQRPMMSLDPAGDFPAYADGYRRWGVGALMGAPITAGDKRLGVLAVDAPRAPLFADDDLRLVTMLANQAAVILESRALLDEAARVRAEAEMTRLKNDFLSSAAHDLKTPLTTLLGRAQLLERRIARAGDAPPVYAEDARQIASEAKRLSGFVVELLDAARVEGGGLLGRLEPVDLAALARQVAERHESPTHPCPVDAEQPLVGLFDATRVTQLLANLIENGVKYSPEGGTVRTTIRRDGERVEIAVSDEGIGVPAEDLPRLFEQFRRGTNVDDRHFAGLGLGLYICRGIVEQHGGRIWAERNAGVGSTFRVKLPFRAAEPALAGIGPV
jgi:signal transduction histidine kinase